jgi:hypothetical protein
MGFLKVPSPLSGDHVLEMVCAHAGDRRNNTIVIVAMFLIIQFCFSCRDRRYPQIAVSSAISAGQFLAKDKNKVHGKRNSYEVYG